jgi:hypothetical protein
VCCLGLTRRSLQKDPRSWAKAAGGHHRDSPRESLRILTAGPNVDFHQRSKPPCTFPRATARHVSLRQFRLSTVPALTQGSVGTRGGGSRWRAAGSATPKAPDVVSRSGPRGSRVTSRHGLAEVTARSPMPRAGRLAAAARRGCQPASHRGRTRGAPVTGVRWLRAAGSPVSSHRPPAALAWARDVPGARSPPPQQQEAKMARRGGRSVRPGR